ncbi:MAG: Zn-dependent protease [Proteobacteria bacterium SG_bin7]|nr:MAG: Zn-dependent protease [Proteobacteria bacterium SG_bin7]
MHVDMMGLVAEIGMKYLPFLFALCFHEFAHGWVAKLKGDRTAEIMGRLTMNPLVHMDPIGTFVIPILMFSGAAAGIPLFGWAKPVPVNERNLQSPIKDMFWIALAGPLSNLLLAVIGMFAFVLVSNHVGDTVKGLPPMLDIFVYINLALAFFNLIPLHPLDGGKVFARFLPRDVNYWLEENQGTLNIVLIVLFVTGAFRIITYPVMWTREFLFSIMSMVVP